MAKEDNANKLTYDQLVNVAAKLDSENKELRKAVQALSNESLYRKLEWLWQVITCNEKELFGEEFVVNCINEFKTLMTPPKTEDKE